METVDNQQDLSALWRRTAHRSTDGQLVACVVVGLVAIVGLITAMLLGVSQAFRWWPVGLPAVLAAAFGTWGIADRELSERLANGAVPRALVVVRWLSAALGAAVGVVTALVFLRLTIGTWIS
jgi:hypothetical protein